MTFQPTSRRAFVAGAAMLTAIPVSALGSVPAFDVVEDLTPAPLLPHPFEVRIATAARWLDLPAPPLTYDPEDLAGGPLVTEALVAWMRDTGRPMAEWIIGGKPEGYTREQALADRKDWLDSQEFLEAIRHLDSTELQLFLDGIKRGMSGEVPFDVALQECRQAMDAYRAQNAGGAVF